MMNILLMALATGTITVTVSRSTVFARLRQAIAARSAFLGKLFYCTYCFSHWAAAFSVLAFAQPRHVLEFLWQWLAVTAVAAPVIAGIMHSHSLVPPAAETVSPDENE